MLMRMPWAVTAAAVLSLCLAPPAQAQAPATLQEEAEHEALREIRRIYEQAVDQNQIELLRPLLHPEFTGVMVTGRAVASIDEVRDYWRDIWTLIGEGGRYSSTVKPEWSTLFGDVAVARGTTEDVVVTGEGREFRFETFWTAVLQKDDGRWKLRRVQGSMDPVTNPFVREFMRRTALQGGFVGGAIGLAVGFGAAFLIARRRRRTAG